MDVEDQLAWLSAVRAFPCSETSAVMVYLPPGIRAFATAVPVRASDGPREPNVCQADWDVGGHTLQVAVAFGSLGVAPPSVSGALYLDTPQEDSPTKVLALYRPAVSSGTPLHARLFIQGIRVPVPDVVLEHRKAWSLILGTPHRPEPRPGWAAVPALLEDALPHVSVTGPGAVTFVCAAGKGKPSPPPSWFVVELPPGSRDKLEGMPSPAPLRQPNVIPRGTLRGEWHLGRPGGILRVSVQFDHHGTRRGVAVRDSVAVTGALTALDWKDDGSASVVVEYLVRRPAPPRVQVRVLLQSVQVGGTPFVVVRRDPALDRAVPNVSLTLTTVTGGVLAPQKSGMVAMTVLGDVGAQANDAALLAITSRGHQLTVFGGRSGAMLASTWMHEMMYDVAAVPQANAKVALVAASAYVAEVQVAIVKGTSLQATTTVVRKAFLGEFVGTTVATDGRVIVVGCGVVKETGAMIRVLNYATMERLWDVGPPGVHRGQLGAILKLRLLPPDRVVVMCQDQPWLTLLSTAPSGEGVVTTHGHPHPCNDVVVLDHGKVVAGLDAHNPGRLVGFSTRTGAKQAEVDCTGWLAPEEAVTGVITDATSLFWIAVSKDKFRLFTRI